MSKYINSMMQISAASVVMMSAVFAEQATTSPTSSAQCVPMAMCSSYPMLKNGCDVHMDIGYLLEQFVLTGTDFAYTLANGGFIDDAEQTFPVSSNILRPKFNVASGLTAELGYYFHHDNWFLNSKFDWVSRKGHKSFSAVGTEQVVPFSSYTTNLLGGNDVYGFAYAKDNLKVSYYDLQIDLNRGTYVTKSLSLEPHTGLKAAWIYYTDNQTFASSSDLSAAATILQQENTTSFWGLGPDFGLNSMWCFGSGFSMYCDTTVALLCGGANAKYEAKYNESETYEVYASERPIVFTPTARAVLGFQYNSSMYDESQNVRVRVGLDTAYYWNQFQHVANTASYTGQLLSLADQGSFAMIGLIVELGWDF